MSVEKLQARAKVESIKEQVKNLAQWLNSNFEADDIMKADVVRRLGLIGNELENCQAITDLFKEDISDWLEE